MVTAAGVRADSPVHVVPCNDQVTHTVPVTGTASPYPSSPSSSTDSSLSPYKRLDICICGPDVEWLLNKDRDFTALVIHSSLDNRERYEND